MISGALLLPLTSSAERTTLGIDAGGNIAWDIHACKSDPRLGMGRTLRYSHPLVNSQDFTIIMRLVPPESSINGKTYAVRQGLGTRHRGEGHQLWWAFDDLVSLEESESRQPNRGRRDKDRRDKSWVISQKKIPASPLVLLETLI